MDLVVPAIEAQKLVVLGAAWLGKVRLIDNVEIDAPGGRPVVIVRWVSPSSTDPNYLRSAASRSFAAIPTFPIAHRAMPSSV
jgi:hypothetical protein